MGEALLLTVEACSLIVELLCLQSVKVLTGGLFPIVGEKLQL